MIRVNNWSSFQSYKDRKPPWIRFHRSIIDNYQFQMMSANARAILPMLWLLACEHHDPTSGIVDAPIDEISFRLRQTEKILKSVFKELQSAGFIECIDSVTESLRDSNQTVSPETETEAKRETEKKRKRELMVVAKNILEYLNSKAGKNYRDTDTNLSFIFERIKEGYESNDFEKAVDNQVREWGDDPKMKKFLRPATLFQKTKFDGYVNNGPGNTEDDYQWGGKNG